MQSKKTKSVNTIGDYNTTNHSIDLTTIKVDDNNKGYLIDQRLLDVLLSKFTKGTLDDIKAELMFSINKAESKDELFANIDEYIYLDNIHSMVPKKESNGVISE